MNSKCGPPNNKYNQNQSDLKYNYSSSLADNNNKDEFQFRRNKQFDTSTSDRLFKLKSNINSLQIEYGKLRKSFNNSSLSLSRAATVNSIQLDDPTTKTNLRNLIEQTQEFFLFLAANDSKQTTSLSSQANNNSHRNNETEFVLDHNEILIEIVTFIGTTIGQISKNESSTDQLYELFYIYSQLVINLAEKSPLKMNNSKINLNKMIEILTEMAFYLIKTTSPPLPLSPQQKLNNNNNQTKNDYDLEYEIYRALGSLIYENGSILNEFNLNRLLGSNPEKFDSNENNNSQLPLLFEIRRKIDANLETLLKQSNPVKEQVVCLDLITTQLIYNLTMPQSFIESISSKSQAGINTTAAAAAAAAVDSIAYIDDKYKIKCAYLLIKILRIHSIGGELFPVNKLATTNDNKSTESSSLSSSLSSSSNEKYHVDTTRILTKALQGLENLFVSIQNTSTSVDYQFKSNWLQMASPIYFQLGDILAIAKKLSFYGIHLSNRIKSTLSPNQPNENKLEPSQVNLLLSAEKKKPNNKQNEDDLGGLGGSAGGAGGGGDDLFDEFENDFPNSNKSQQGGSIKIQNNKRNKDNPLNSESKQNKSNKHFAYKQTNSTNKQMGATSTSAASPSSSLSSSSVAQTSIEQINKKTNNSVQCLRENQLPLIQFKNSNFESETNSNQSQPNNSEHLAEPFSSSKFYIEKCNAKVRVTAMGVLLTAFQSLDKRTVLSYWDSFLGTNTNFNLIWSIRYDNSPKVRLMASTALTVYLECARAFFSLAATEDTNQAHSFSTLNTQSSASAFVPISYTIAHLIRHLHKELLHLLTTSEKFALNLIQLLKCLQCLIKATPYHKLKPGLIYKLITSLRYFLIHKSFHSKENLTNVYLELLNCLVLILTTHQQLAEVHLALIANDRSLSSQTNSVENPAQNSDDLDNLSTKLEHLTNVIKVPTISQSRVTYFYTSNNDTGNNSFKSSLNDSLSVSGQMTPSLNELINEDDTNTNKSWLVGYCIKQSIMSQQNLSNNQLRIVSIELLSIICRKYFDLLRKDLFFDDLCQLILFNIDYLTTSSSLPSMSNNNDSSNEQVLLKTLKLLEEFARCLATSELRTMNSIDLNDCCKFWSLLLNSKLISQILCDEQRYLLSSAACDCLSSIGASVFELLPFQKRIYCLTNLLHLTKSQSNLIRSSSIRALGVYVTFTSLKEDQNFLNDLSQCVLSLLANDTNNLVRQKTAWSLSNLSEVLVENGDKLGKIFKDEFSLIVWLRLLDTASNACLRDSDKLKSYLVRTLGNLICFISQFDIGSIRKELNNDLSKVERSLTKAIDALCQCKNVKMLKVKWNLSHAIGVAMRDFNTWKLQLNNPKWLNTFYDTLLELFTQSSNFKVRINACMALMNLTMADRSVAASCLSTETSTNSTPDSTIYIRLWCCLIEAFSKLNNDESTQIDTSNEAQHKNTLIHQLCKFLTYLCKYLRTDDLDVLMVKCFNEIKLNSSKIGTNNQSETTSMNNSNLLTISQLRTYLADYLRKIFEQIDSNKQEVQLFNEALIQLNVLNSNKTTSLNEDCVHLLNGLLQRSNNGSSSRSAANEESESSETEYQHNDTDTKDADFNEENKFSQLNLNKKFPFKQTYD